MRKSKTRDSFTHDADAIIEGPAGPTAIDTALEFGRFRVLLRQRRLLADRVPVELGTRAFEILMVLIEADGTLVTKDELLSRVWPGIVVEQANLKVQIAALRSALGEDRDLIRTDFGRGYRFTAAVRSTGAAPECLSASAVMPAPALPKAESSTDLSAVGSQLARLEVKLAEAVNLLTARHTTNRLRRHRYRAGYSGRRFPPGGRGGSVSR